MLGDLVNHEECNSDLQTVKEESEKGADLAKSCQPKISSNIVKFDWNSRWLNGEEYSYILTHAELYMAAFAFQRYPQKTHPKETYNNPES